MCTEPTSSNIAHGSACLTDVLNFIVIAKHLIIFLNIGQIKFLKLKWLSLFNHCKSMICFYLICFEQLHFPEKVQVNVHNVKLLVLLKMNYAYKPNLCMLESLQ